jgi:DNA-nicking Smr family endonuclease
MRKVKRADQPLSQEDAQLLAQALAQVIPLKGRQRVVHRTPVPRVNPTRRQHAAEMSAVDLPLSDGVARDPADVLESFQRPGVSGEILRRLKRESPKIRESLDLHGLNREQARLAVGHFIQTAASQGIKRVRIIHGQGFGSSLGAGLLRQQTRHWLTQIHEVLAFVGAPAQDGGKGAVLVLLRTPKLSDHG